MFKKHDRQWSFPNISTQFLTIVVEEITNVYLMSKVIYKGEGINTAILSHKCINICKYSFPLSCRVSWRQSNSDSKPGTHVLPNGIFLTVQGQDEEKQVYNSETVNTLRRNMTKLKIKSTERCACVMWDKLNQLGLRYLFLIYLHFLNKSWHKNC